MSAAPFTIATGIPTEPDVRALEKEIGVPQIGALVPYERVAAIIKAPYRSQRFQTVTTAWRGKLFRELNVFIVAEAGKGFVALDPSRRVSHSHRRYKSGLRKVYRAGVVAQKTDGTKLNPDERRAQDHMIRAAAAIKMAAAEAARQIPPPTL